MATNNSTNTSNPITVAQGGTGASTLTGVLSGNGTSAVTASALTQHDVLVGGASNAITSVAPSATTGVPLISQGSSADPAFGTAVVAGGGTGATSFTAYSVVCAGTTSTGTMQNVSGVGTAGQILVSNGAGALPSWQSFASTTYVNQTTSTTMNPDTGYIANSGSLITLTLPTTSAVGTVIAACGFGAGGWKIAQGSGQQIFFGSVSTTLGATGYLASSNQYDNISLVCVSANTTWVVTASIGNITYN